MGYTTTANTQMMLYVQRLLTLAPGEFLFLFFIALLVFIFTAMLQLGTDTKIIYNLLPLPSLPCLLQLIPQQATKGPNTLETGLLVKTCGCKPQPHNGHHKHQPWWQGLQGLTMMATREWHDGLLMVTSTSSHNDRQCFFGVKGSVQMDCAFAGHPCSGNHLSLFTIQDFINQYIILYIHSTWTKLS